MARKKPPKGRRKVLSNSTASCQLLDEEARLANNPSRAGRRYIKQRLKRLGKQLTPPRKQAAIDLRRPMIAKAREIIRRDGMPGKVIDLIKQLDGAEALTRVTRRRRKGEAPREHKISDSTARRILKDVLGVRGPCKRKRRSKYFEFMKPKS
jgi:hypothetical protein